MSESSIVYTVVHCLVRNADGTATDRGAGALYFLVDSVGVPHLCRLQASGGANLVFRFADLVLVET